MSSIFQGQIGKNTDKEKIKEYDRLTREAEISKYKDESLIKGINVSKILKDIIPLKSGGFVTIRPAQIAETVKVMLNDMRDDPLYSFIKPYIKKPVIWTYQAKTAFTDGIRIYMSPFFAHRLLMGEHVKEADKWFDSLTFSEKRDQKNADKYNAMITKYIRFVIIHEAYHIIYNHVRRAALKYGGKPTENEKETGNIAMDLEINRDIESCFENLRGSTEHINGIWYLDKDYYKSDGTVFKKDIWEDVWDDFMENNKDFQTSGAFNDEGVNPTQESEEKVGPYADGWRKAVDAIKNHRINPSGIDISDLTSDAKTKDLYDELIKALK